MQVNFTFSKVKKINCVRRKGYVENFPREALHSYWLVSEEQEIINEELSRVQIELNLSIILPAGYHIPRNLLCELIFLREKAKNFASMNLF